MSTREIQGHLEALYGTDVSPALSSNIPLLRRELPRMPSVSEYVFTSPGNRLSSSITTTFRRSVTGAGLKDVTLHTLRHSFASHLAMRGVPIAHIQQLMGHQDYTTALVYVHVSQESVKGPTNLLPYANH